MGAGKSGFEKACKIRLFCEVSVFLPQASSAKSDERG
jgi:hypothetical protein